jgi:DNA-binding CsgD family transcriptional regulator/N-acetylneuraminic acid mutarotase
MIPTDIDLSEREREIIRLVATGASNKQIAQDLFISTNTVKVHLRNIFAKIGVTSRTEATLYAIREGLVAAPGGGIPSVAREDLNNEADEALLSEEVLPPPEKKARPWMVASGIFLVVLLIGISIFLLPRVTGQNNAKPTEVVSRWQTKSPLPAARSGLAAAAVEDKIYAVGGETPTGVTGEVDCYTTSTDTWKILGEMRYPVTDVSAAAIGGKVYVPGGRLSNGEIFDGLQVFDPDTEKWTIQASMPVRLSGYALVILDGKIFLFGGWNGTNAVKSVFVYSPDQDQWQQKTDMPVARAFAGAIALDNRIFVIGGLDGTTKITDTDLYTPAHDGSSVSPWQVKPPAPAPIYQFGILNVLDKLYIIGSGLDKAPANGQLIYDLPKDAWETVSQNASPTTTSSAMVTVIDKVYLIGGKVSGKVTNQVMSYQFIYIIAFPGVSS